MDTDKKRFSFYWNVIKIPFGVLFMLNVLAVAFALTSYPLYKGIFASGISMAIALFVYGFVGWTAVKNFGLRASQSAWAGCLTGFFGGIAGAFQGLIMFYTVPTFVKDTIAYYISTGQPADTAPTMIMFGTYANFIIRPLFWALIGAVIALVVGFVASKMGGVTKKRTLPKVSVVKAPARKPTRRKAAKKPAKKKKAKKR